MKPDWQLAIGMARAGHGWEDIRLRCGLSELDARGILWGRIKAEAMMKVPALIRSTA